MTQERVKLDTAAFLDSPQSRALSGVEREQQRRLVEAFLACAYEEVGKAPHLIDGEDLHAIVGQGMPARLRRREAAVEHAGDVLAAYLAHLAERAVVAHTFELHNALDASVAELRVAVESGETVRRAPPSRPFEHRAERTGRNDPCPCGSGRKFKKCCG